MSIGDTNNIAFLRGINMMGKNRVPMQELKNAFENIGFSNVKTLLNSGNVSFASDGSDKKVLKKDIEKELQKIFGFYIPVYISDTEIINDILKNAPEWWGNEDKSIYDNLIFVLPGTSLEDIINKLGEPSEGLEKVMIYHDVIFWSFDRARYQKCAWWKRTAAPDIGKLITIRTANTVKKIREL